jgi:predicted membrane protein
VTQLYIVGVHFYALLEHLTNIVGTVVHFYTILNFVGTQFNTFVLCIVWVGAATISVQ